MNVSRASVLLYKVVCLVSDEFDALLFAIVRLGCKLQATRLYERMRDTERTCGEGNRDELEIRYRR